MNVGFQKVSEKIMGKLSKKVLIAICGGAIVVAIGGGYAVYRSASNSSPQNQRNAGVNIMGNMAYMEETVATGDIVVGISEMGTASMQQEAIGYDFAVEVETFYVKAGENVQKGQSLGLLDLETVTEQKDALTLEIADATTALAEANAEYDLKIIQAQKTYSQSIYNGENADALYAKALAEIDEKYASLGATADERSVTLYYAYSAQSSGVSTVAIVAAEDAKKQADLARSVLANQLSGTVDAIFSATSNEAMYYCLYDEVTGLYTFAAYDADGDGMEDGAPSGYVMTSEVLALLNMNCVNAEAEYNIAYNTYLKEKNALDAAVTTALANYETAYDAYTDYGMELEYYKITAETDYQTNLANYAAAQDVYNNAVAKYKNRVETAQQALAQLQTQYAAYEALPEDGVIKASCSGYVMRLAEVETPYNAGVALVTLGSDQSVELSVSISQDDIADVAIGMETNIVFDAYEEYSIPAVVESISTSSASGMTSSVNYTVEISCDISAYEDLVVFDSMSATITFVQRQVTGVMMVSSKCISTENGVSYVKRLDEQGNITTVAVETGFSDGFDVEIVSGLQIGDVVMIESAVG